MPPPFLGGTMATPKYVSLDEFKEFIHMDVTDTSEDNLITALLMLAEEYVESETGMTWGSTSVSYTFETRDGKTVDLYPFAFWDITNVTSNGTAVDINELNFYPLNKPYFFISVKDDSSVYLTNPIVVTGIEGYGDIPEAIKTLIKKLAYHLYRTHDFTNQAQILPDGTYLVRNPKFPSDLITMLQSIAARV